MHIGYGAAFQHLDEYPDARFMREQLELCVEAERIGFESIWLPEHHFSRYAISPNPLQLLSYLAGRTAQVKLGVAVIVLPWHDPLRTAEDVILLDHVSEGRTIVGVGRGLAHHEFEGLRVNQDEARDRFAEHAALLLQALETGTIEGGALTQQPQRMLRPTPFHSFQGRVFSAAVSAESGPLVARLGMGILFVNLKPSDALRAELEVYERVWRSQHPIVEPPRPLHSSILFVDESGERAAERARTYSRRSFEASVTHYGMAEQSFGTAKGYEAYRAMRIGPETDVDAAAANFAKSMPHGTPQQILDFYARIKRDIDPQAFVIHFHFGGMDIADARRNIECFRKHCLPEMKSWPASCTFDLRMSA